VTPWRGKSATVRVYRGFTGCGSGRGATQRARNILGTGRGIHRYYLVLEAQLFNRKTFWTKPLAAVLVRSVSVSMLRIFSTRAEDHAENSYTSEDGERSL
jgi:3-methyladenine DNA glycosylase Mpg